MDLKTLNTQFIECLESGTSKAADKIYPWFIGQKEKNQIFISFLLLQVK